MYRINILKTRMIENECVSMLFGAFQKDTRIISTKTICTLHKIPKNEVIKTVKKLILHNKLMIGVNCLDVKGQLTDLCLNVKSVFGISPENPDKENVFVLTEQGYIEVLKHINYIHSMNLKPALKYFK